MILAKMCETLKVLYEPSSSWFIAIFCHCQSYHSGSDMANDYQVQFILIGEMKLYAKIKKSQNILTWIVVSLEKMHSRMDHVKLVEDAAF